MAKKVTKNKKSNLVETNPTIFEPKVQNRWICYIEAGDKELVPVYLIRGFQRPVISRSISEEKIKEIAVSPTITRRLGKPSVISLVSGDIVLDVYDPINPSASKIFTSLLNSHQVFTVRLVILGPVGDKVEEWVYSGCRINSLSFSNLNWGNNSDPSTITATIHVLSAKVL